MAAAAGLFSIIYFTLCKAAIDLFTVDEPDETTEPVASSGFEFLKQGTVHGGLVDLVISGILGGPKEDTETVSSSGFGFLNQGIAYMHAQEVISLLIYRSCW